MYVPTHFKEDRVPVLHDAIRHAGLATLVTEVRRRLNRGRKTITPRAGARLFLRRSHRLQYVTEAPGTTCNTERA